MALWCLKRGPVLFRCRTPCGSSFSGFLTSSRDFRLNLFRFGLDLARMPIGEFPRSWGCFKSDGLDQYRTHVSPLVGGRHP